MTAYDGFGFPAKLGDIAATVQAQASIMSYLDVFWLLGVATLCVWPLALLLPRLPKDAAPAH